MYTTKNLVIKYGPEHMNLLGTGCYGNTNAGFFCQSSVLFTCILEYYKINNKWPEFIDTTEQMGIYKSSEQKDVDIVCDFFKTNENIKQINPHAFFHPDFHYGDIWTFPYYDYEPIVKRYFNPSDKIQNIIQNLEKKYNLNYDNICSIYYRGTDKSTEAPILSKIFMKDRIEHIKQESPDIQLLFQSDQTEFIQEMKQQYPDAIFFEENTHNTGNIGVHNYYKNTDDNYHIILNFVAIMFIMSRCKYIITGAGNCGLWLALLRTHNVGYHNFFFFKNERETPVHISPPLILPPLIPKQIFQTWETKDLCQNMSQIVDSWQYKNLDYTYELHDKHDRETFIKDHFDTRVLTTFQKLKPGSFKSDLWRYCILYIHGGFYSDIDTECLGSLATINHSNIKFIATIDISIEQYNIAGGAILGCIPKHPIMWDCIQKVCYYVENQIWPGSMEFCGPGCLGMALNRFLGCDETSSNRDKVGYQNDDILLLRFEPGSEYVYAPNNEKLMQNKNGSSKIQQAYAEQCGKTENYIDWGQFNSCDAFM